MSNPIAVAATQWSNDGKVLRVYSLMQDGTISEKCWNGSGPWVNGATLSSFHATESVSAISWLNGGKVEIRVYTVFEGKTMEYAYDGSNWNHGGAI